MEEIIKVATGEVYFEEYYNDYNEGYYLANPELKESQKQQEEFITQVINSTKEESRGIVSKLSSLKVNIFTPTKFKSAINSSKKEKITAYDRVLKAHRLRTAEYWVIAGKLEKPFLPDFMRIPAIAGYRAHLVYVIRYLIQNVMDKIAIKRLMEGEEMLSPIVIPIPNGASAFLSKYYTSHSIEEAFDTMREKFAEHKKKIVEWEDRQFKINRTTVVGERDKLRNEINSTIASSLKGTGKTEITEIGASLIDSMVSEALTGQAQPPGSLPIFKLAMNFIEKSLAKNRIWYYLWGKKEADNIKDQHALLEYAFRNSLDDVQGHRFSDLADSLYRLTKMPNLAKSQGNKYVNNSQQLIVPANDNDPLHILKLRLAKGEITKEDYDGLIGMIRS